MVMRVLSSMVVNVMLVIMTFRMIARYARTLRFSTLTSHPIGYDISMRLLLFAS